MQGQDNTEVLAYWLATTSTLLLLVQRTVKASNTQNIVPHRNRSSPNSFFSRMAQVGFPQLKFTNTFWCQHFTIISFIFRVFVHLQ